MNLQYLLFLKMKDFRKTGSLMNVYEYFLNITEAYSCHIKEKYYVVITTYMLL